ncbi:hypothetical protein EXIGLDRAFT_745014, partial [Exidia glandulosa HHB12029]
MYGVLEVELGRLYVMDSGALAWGRPDRPVTDGTVQIPLSARCSLHTHNAPVQAARLRRRCRDPTWTDKPAGSQTSLCFTDEVTLSSWATIVTRCKAAQPFSALPQVLDHDATQEQPLYDDPKRSAQYPRAHRWLEKGGGRYERRGKGEETQRRCKRECREDCSMNERKGSSVTNRAATGYEVAAIRTDLEKGDGECHGGQSASYIHIRSRSKVAARNRNDMRSRGKRSDAELLEWYLEAQILGLVTVRERAAEERAEVDSIGPVDVALREKELAVQIVQKQGPTRSVGWAGIMIDRQRKGVQIRRTAEDSAYLHGTVVTPQRRDAKINDAQRGTHLTIHENDPVLAELEVKTWSRQFVQVGQIVFPRARSVQIRPTTLKAGGHTWNRLYHGEGRWPKSGRADRSFKRIDRPGAQYRRPRLPPACMVAAFYQRGRSTALRDLSSLRAIATRFRPIGWELQFRRSLYPTHRDRTRGAHTARRALTTHQRHFSAHYSTLSLTDRRSAPFRPCRATAPAVPHALTQLRVPGVKLASRMPNSVNSLNTKFSVSHFRFGGDMAIAFRRGQRAGRLLLYGRGRFAAHEAREARRLGKPSFGSFCIFCKGAEVDLPTYGDLREFDPGAPLAYHALQQNASINGALRDRAGSRYI